MVSQSECLISKLSTSHIELRIHMLHVLGIPWSRSHSVDLAKYLPIRGSLALPRGFMEALRAVSGVLE